MDNRTFEDLLSECRNAVERFVYYKLPTKEDAQDVLQEIFMTSYQKFDTLQDKSKFKSWILTIASNKCNDYFRKKMNTFEIPVEDIYTYEISSSKIGITVTETVRETLENLNAVNSQILYLFYIKGLNQKDISKKLDIPVGTVKSRLNNARQKFKEKYPYPPDLKGEINMSLFPEISPRIKIVKSGLEEFPVKCEQDIGWFASPKLNEKSSFATYDFDKYPVMKKTSETHTEVNNSAIIHGVNCVELEITQINEADKNNIRKFSFFERLTDTHLQTVASLYNCKNNVKKFHTFLDSDFNDVWGYGDDNCGVELKLKPKGLIISDNSGALTAKNKDVNTLDIVGRFTVFIGDKSYDTVREIFYDTSDELVENYIAKDGRVILFRRFNKYDWNVGKDKPYKVLWTEQLPESDKLTLNSDIYVHWYNSIPEYAL